MIKSLPLFAAAILVAASASAQDDVVLTPTADTWLRSDKAADNSASTKLEFRSEFTEDEGVKTYTKDFVAVLVFSAPTVPDGYEIESATLRVTTERIKADKCRETNLYAITGDIAENGKYADYAEQIAAARATDAITSLTLKGLNGKSVASDNITSEDFQTIAAWQNTADVTSYVKGVTSSSFGILLCAVNTNTQSNCIFSKEATAISNSNCDYFTSVTASDLTPQITVTFKATETPKEEGGDEPKEEGGDDPKDPTAISSISSDTDANAPIFNILGQKVSASYKGIVIRNGKKFIQK